MTGDRPPESLFRSYNRLACAPHFKLLLRRLSDAFSLAPVPLILIAEGYLRPLLLRTPLGVRWPVWLCRSHRNREEL